MVPDDMPEIGEVSEAEFQQYQRNLFKAMGIMEADGTLRLEGGANGGNAPGVDRMREVVRVCDDFVRDKKRLGIIRGIL
jgi:hypothetical protein